jgi:hypothetical protein
VLSYETPHCLADFFFSFLFLTMRKYSLQVLSMIRKLINNKADLVEIVCH